MQIHSLCEVVSVRFYVEIMFTNNLYLCIVYLYTCARFGELWHTNPWDPRAILLFLKTNRLGHVLFPFARWQLYHAQTALCSGVGTTWKVVRLNSERLPSPAAKGPPSTQLGGLGERCKLPSSPLSSLPLSSSFSPPSSPLPSPSPSPSLPSPPLRSRPP